VGLLVYLILLAFLGLITGALARLILPGPDPMSIVQTIALGLAGTFVAGIVLWALFGHGVPGLVVSVAFSTLILYFIRRSRGGSLTRPAARRR
jgi:uncharacterized membrane protein YeaQ/YmgE (transglycosylase-associated protein family)